MNLKGITHLGWRHLRRNRAKTTLLIGALTVALSLPIILIVLVDQAEDHFRHRAESTPLVLGAAGSELELAFNSLYFSKPGIATMEHQQLSAETPDGLATGIPLDVRFAAQGVPIVGTSVDYFKYRQLQMATGRAFVGLGECVVGATAARELGATLEGSVISSPDAIFDLGGVYPLKMKIVGILSSSGEADDRAIFVDVKTTWVISGLAHGHQEANETPEAERLASDDETIALNAAVVEYNEVTPANLDSFHFHGDPETFPLTSALLFPKDQKSQTILLGRNRETQLIEPPRVMDDLFATVFKVRDVAIFALALSATVALIVCALVFLLSNRLRTGEFSSLTQIGASSSFVRGLMMFEGAFVILASLILTSLAGALALMIAPFLLKTI